MAIHQILVSAAPGDAITNQAFELRALLRRVGPSEIFARHVHPAVVGEVLPLADHIGVASTDGTDLLVFHASIGEPEVLGFLLTRPERLVLVYHNISPAEAFRPYDPAFAELLVEGRRELDLLRDRVTLAIADSSYNAEELRALGYADVRVAPLVLDLDGLRSVVPDPHVAAELDGLEGPVVLAVGQMHPHKRPDLVARAFHLLSSYLIPTASCYLVGAVRAGGYGTVLREYVAELNLPRLHLTGSVPLEVLAAYWRRADVFVTLSEHEGFCVPLVEAMAFDVPIVARAQPAMRETAGDAALFLPLSDDPLEMGAELAAEAIAAVLADAPVRDGLVEAGRRRLQAFDPDRARAGLLGHLLDAA